MLALWLALFAAPAQADEIDAWVKLYDGLLTEAADNDIEAAVTTYQGLARTLPAGQPLRGITLYWLGRALDSDGDERAARDALRECVRAGNARTRCLDLLGRIELESAAVRTVPTTWTFDDSTHGFIHPWVYADMGSIRLEDSGGPHGKVLVWSTTVSPDSDDQLLLGFSQPRPAPSRLRFDVLATRQDAALRLVVFDTLGRRYLSDDGGAVEIVHRDRWQRIRLNLNALSPLDDDAPLNPSQIDHLVLQDISAFQGAPSGPNELWIDDVEVY